MCHPCRLTASSRLACVGQAKLSAGLVSSSLDFVWDLDGGRCCIRGFDRLVCRPGDGALVLLLVLNAVCPSRSVAQPF